MRIVFVLALALAGCSGDVDPNDPAMNFKVEGRGITSIGRMKPDAPHSIDAVKASVQTSTRMLEAKKK
jgi:hypothetical protein